jgi:signal transduction histidine kinase
MQAGRITGAVLGAGAAGELLLRLAAGDVGRVGAITPPTVIMLLLLCLLTTMPFFTERRSAAALVIDLACVVSLSVFGFLTYAGGAALLLVAYLTGRRGPSWLAVGLGAPFLVLALASRGWPVVLLAGLTPAVALAGCARRASGSARLADDVRSLSDEVLSENFARGERARIARELHDVVAHHISMVSVQAETARLTTPGLCAAGAKRFAEIGETARTGLTEMRRLLGVLRPDVDAVADRQPQPGLAQLAELVDTARSSSGTATRLIVSGAVTSLDAGVELAAFRIVQEALTNVRRHAPGAAVDVELRFAGEELVVGVRDNGPGPVVDDELDASGHGLLGMRERAAAVGGTLRAGPAAGGGFRVEAVLPAKVLVG